MERLTQWINEERAIPRVDLRNCGHEKCTTQLARYEDTGLTPDQIEGLKERMNDGWIPVEERLPEEPEKNPVFDDKPLELYLVDMGGSYPLRAFWNGKKFTDGWSALDVKAWMPLPEPYQPKRGSEGWNRPRRDK